MTWPTKKLADLLESCDAGVWGKPAIKGKGLFVLRSTNMTNEGRINFSDVAERKIEGDIKKLELLDGDILVEKSGGGPNQPVGRVAYFIAPDDRVYTFANFVQRFRAKPDLINSHFLFYRLLFLHKIGFTKKLQSQTTGIRNLKLSLYLKTEIPVPPLKIQKQIVERLDAIKKVQELNDKQIELADELKKSLIHNFETIGKKWPRIQLGECVSFLQLGLVKSREKYSDKGVPYLKMDAIQSNGELDFEKAIKVIADESEIQRCKLKIGDFLFNTRNTPELVGKSAVFNEKRTYLFNNNILRLRFKNLLPLFLNAFFQTIDGKRALNSKKKGTTSVWAIYQSDLLKIKIPFPPIETQRQAVEKLFAVQEYKKKLIKQKLKELFESVLNKSMKGELI
ncbi:restriction endonuclease subunit S [Patescibacteria group bacterium AH-259-L07]|nr:restriction endonuclease subunit S [Patescibacteria group bacterium AH-259-L07]